MVDNLCEWQSERLNLHVVVVDNNSPDSSFQILSDRYREAEIVDVLSTDRNGGYSYGNNYGTRYAIEKYDPQYIAIANPDVVLDVETIEKLLDTFKYDDRIAMCSPIMKALDGSYEVRPWQIQTYKGDLAECWLLGKPHVSPLPPVIIGENNTMITEALPGSFFVIRRDCFEEVSFLDENVFLFCEERILGRKIKEAGYLAAFRIDLFYIHAHSVSLNKALNVKKQQSQLLKSRRYYLETYDHCGKFSMAVLRIAQSLYMLQLSGYLFLKDLRRWI